MRVAVIGAGGAIGRPLLRQLAEAGHEPLAFTRSERKAAAMSAAGTPAQALDVFSDELDERLEAARPEAVVYQATAIPQALDPRRMTTQLAQTSRLRREGGPRVAAAAERAGAGRLIAQSIAFAAAPRGAEAVGEDAPLWTDAPGGFDDVIGAVAALEDTVARSELEGTVLRYGYFYGPGTAYAREGAMAEAARRRRLPIIGRGAGRLSFVHLDDAASATVAALGAPPGIYHVVDDDPAPSREVIPLWCAAVGAPPPRRVPAWLARILAGPAAVATMTAAPGASNARARDRLGWAPGIPTWREGFRSAIG